MAETTKAKVIKVPPAVAFALAVGWGNQLERLREDKGGGLSTPDGIDAVSVWDEVFPDDEVQYWAKVLGPFARIKGSTEEGKHPFPLVVYATLAHALSEFLTFLAEQTDSVEMNVMLRHKKSSDERGWYGQIIAVFDDLGYKLKSPVFGPLDRLRLFDLFDFTIGRDFPFVLMVPETATVNVNFWIVHEDEEGKDADA
jgi:hypothetical protein